MGCRGSKQRSLGDEAVSPRSQATFFSVIVGVDDVRDVNIQTDDAQNDETYNLSYHTADGANEVSAMWEVDSDDDFDFDEAEEPAMGESHRESQPCDSQDCVCDSAGRMYSAPFWGDEGVDDTPFDAARRESDVEGDPDSYLASQEELVLLREMKESLADLLAEEGISQADDVVGALNMLRFLRAHFAVGGMDLVLGYFADMLRWRRDNHIDELRASLMSKRLPDVVWAGHHDVLQHMPTCM